MASEVETLEAFRAWYENSGEGGGQPARGTTAGALQVLDRLQSDYNLDIDDHTAATGKSQIVGVSGENLRAILERFGETREYLKEGGRTNRGLRGAMAGMLVTLQPLKLETLSEAERNRRLTGLQAYLVEQVRSHFNRSRIRFIFDPQKSGWTTVHELLETARDEKKEGAVAQYLVGAKLQLRFPDYGVGNESYSTADAQLGRPGDFVIRDTIFHVTVAPGVPVVERCVDNLQNGLRPYLLTADRVLAAAKQLADLRAPGRITVASIESFVAQNVEELSEFSSRGWKWELRALLTLYNKRVEKTETDKSMLIDIPPNLLA